jgi:flagellin-like protein
MRLNKRAVSPLIATVLLVMITVSIGAAVMVVIQGISQTSIQSTENQQQLIKCSSDVQIDVIRVSDKYRACFVTTNSSSNSGSFAVYLENRGLKDISDWRFTVIGDNVSDLNGGISTLVRGQIKGYRFNFSGTNNVSKVRFSPKISGGPSNPLVTCNLPNLEWDIEDLENFDHCNAATVNWDNSLTS